MTIVLSVLGFTLLYIGQLVYMPTFIGLFVVLGLLAILYITRRYRTVGMIFCLSGSILSQITLIFFPQEFHFVDLMWIIIIVLYTFFMLGRIWGVAIIILNTIGVIYFTNAVLNESLTLVGTLTQPEIIGLSVNIAICFSLITYLIFQFLYVIRLAENDFRKINSELQEQNSKVALQNEEKTVMLREIHHRVKNNLQVITSLLRLQSGEIEDPESKEKFDETIHRVISMALIHERMYKSENLSKIDLQGYVQSLSEELIQSYMVQKKIELEINCEIDQVASKSLVSIALIFNELISNSIKHAFHETEVGKIEIEILKLENQTILINYHDNGKWNAASKKGSFGLELIETLCEQLSGSMELTRDPSASYKFEFETKNLIDED